MTRGRNAYNVRELAGAFGDLGTLIPFLVGYLTVSRMDPVGVLVAFGIFKIFVGLYFRTPVPIQPMKAIGTAAITHAGVIAPGAILASGLFTGAFWLLMGVTGAVTWIARLTSRSIVQGLVLGLGLSLMLEGVKLTQGDWLLAVAAMALTFVLLSHERIPAMLLLLAFGAAAALAREPGILAELARDRRPAPAASLRRRRSELGGPGHRRAGPRAPPGRVDARQRDRRHRRGEQRALPRSPDHRPDRGDRPRGHEPRGREHRGRPHVPRGRRHGGACPVRRSHGGSLVMLGVLVLFTGLFLGDSVATLFKLFPASLLGVILLFGGLELATGALGDSRSKQDRYVLLLTAGIAMWNMGAGYLAGLLLHHATRRGVVRL